jgi:hypothetical protein
MVVLVLGCGGGAGTGAITSGNFFARQRAAWCAREVRCGGWDSLTACVAFEERASRYGITLVQPRFDDGTVVIDDEAAQDCFDHTEHASCIDDQHESIATYPACLAARRGTRPDGAACYFADECSGGRCDTAGGCPAGTCCPGTCGTSTRASIGAHCDARAWCTDDAYCDTTATCAPLIAMGGACTSSYTCAAGLVCDDRSSTCQPPPRAGEACILINGAPSCSTVGLSCDTDHQTCVATSRLGGSCDGGRACVHDLVCDNGVCATPVAEGASCALGTCAPGLHCDDTRSPPTCRAPGATGDPCVNIDDCQSYACVNDACAAPAPACE